MFDYGIIENFLHYDQVGALKKAYTPKNTTDLLQVVNFISLSQLVNKL